MADGLCSDGKTVSSLINENSTENGADLVVRGKSISADSVACANGKFQMSETQKTGIKRDHNMTTGANQVQHKVDPELSDVCKISDGDSDGGGGGGGGGNNKNSANSLVSGELIVVNDKKNVSSGASVVLRKNASGKSTSIASEKNGCGSPGLGGGPDVDLIKGPGTTQPQPGQEADDSRTKKKRCSDRYDSSESSDSGVATLSCTDSSTHSSDASDPGSPYSPVSLGDDVHPPTKANMPPQNVLATQTHQQPQQNQQQKSTQHQWPWNAISSTLSNSTTTTTNNNNNNNNNSNKNNNNFSASNKNSVNSVASSNKHKRLTINSSDTSGTAKKARTSCVDSKNQPVVPSAVKRLKAAPADESQTKITGYFKSQMKPLSALKKDFTNLVARSTDVQPSSGLDKYFNILAKVKDDKEHKAKSLEVDVRTLTTMPPSLKKIERKTAKVAQIAPISRKAAGAQLAKSPKKHVAIAPRTTDSKKTAATVSGTMRKTVANAQVDQSKITQPTVLLTAIRIPQTGGQQSSAQQSHQPPKTGSSSAKVGSVFQIPVMPNLVQIPNLLATANGTNLVMNNGQLARVGNGAQYFLNGTVIKLQQIAPGGGHGVSSNNGVLTMESGISGNILVKPPTIAQAVPLTTSSNTKSTLPISPQTPIVTQTGATGTGCGPGINGQTFTNSQRISAQPVFMATTTGLLLNATLPAVIATTTSKIAGSLPPQAMPALQPIQSAATQSSNILPSLSTILQTHHHTAATSQNSLVQPQTQFIVSQADTILSNIPQTTLSTATAKSGSCTALLAATSIAASISSPVPPLVTLASTHETVLTSVTFARNKQSILFAEDKKQTENAIVIKTPKYETKILPDSEIKQEKSPLSNATDIDSLFDKLKNEPPYLPIEKVKEEPIVKQELKPHVFKEELKPCLPSPKSFVLEQIKQKTPPDVFTDESIKTETSSSNSVDTRSSPIDDLKSTSIDTEIEETTLPKCAISPILSQPKTIRFPALSGETAYRFGPKGTKRHDGVCYWDNCNEKHDTSSKLLDHLQTHHVNTQSGPFACLWSGCKVHSRESCSRRWLERHVLSHGGTKPFKCIVDGCGLRFGSQLALQKHVNGHFNSTEHKDNPSKRASDPPVPKLLRKNGKKLRYRRQPFSARMFDFFDSGVMEGLQHRLMVTGSLANGPKGSVTFRGRVMARRCTTEGVPEVFISWSPSEIISDEWVPEIKATLTKIVAIHSLRIQERVALQGRLRTANLYSDISTMFNQTSSITASKSNLLRTSDRKQSRKPPKRIQPS